MNSKDGENGIKPLEAADPADSSDQTSLEASQRKNRNYTIIALGILLFLVISTFGLGPIDLGLYTMQSNDSTGGGWSAQTHEATNYRIDFIYNNQTVRHPEIVDSSVTKTTPLTVKIAPMALEGNYYTPFYKKFKVHYKALIGDAKITNSKTPNEHNEVTLSDTFSGSVEGTSEIEIKGLCSISKAKDIAEQAMVKSIVNTVTTQAAKKPTQ